MKNIYILFLALGLLVFSACTQNNQQEERTTVEIKETATETPLEKSLEIEKEEIKVEDELLLIQPENNYYECQWINGKNYFQAQSFKFNFSKLTRAFFFSDVYNRNLNNQVTLHIRENNINSKDVSNLTKRLQDINKRNWTEWNFLDIDINKDKEYYFVFECPNCDHFACAGFCNATWENICFEYQKDDVYPNGNYWHKGLSTDYLITSYPNWDMAFKIYGVKEFENYTGIINETKKIEILNISKEALSLKIQELYEEGDVLHYLPKVGIGPDIIEEKIIFLDNKWHVDFTIKYNFGCCRGCSPEAICPAVCVFCGNKTKEIYYKIKNDGTIEEEIVTEKTCIGNSGAWFRNITGDELCSIDWNNLN